MRRVYALLIFVFSLAASYSSRAQLFFRATEYGASAGGSVYFGDLNDHYGFQFIRPAVGAFARLHMNQFIALKLVANYTKVGYSDSYNSNAYEKERNLSFESTVAEAAIQAEFNFFRFATGDADHRFTPYLTGGIGAFYYNPYTYYQGSKYYLRPVGTEGQFAGYPDRKYGSVSMCVPIGVGIKYWLTPGMNFSFEIADRLTFTDYLDDVSSTYVGASKFPSGGTTNPNYILQDRSLEINPNSPLGRAGKQRGNSSSYDQYMMAEISLSFQFKTYRCPAYMNKGLIKAD